MPAPTRKNMPRLRDGVMKRGTTWSYVIRVKDPETGISKPRWVGGFATEQDAKAAECTGTLDRRISPADPLAVLPIRDHARRHIAECIRLSKLPGLKELRLAAWAHMLGFGGHFSTKSRTYSTTLGTLRADRAAHQREYAIAAGLQPDLDPGTTLVVTDWHYAGRGHPLIDLLVPTGGVPWTGS